MKSKTLITLCYSAFLSSAIFMQAQAYNFGTGINTNFGTGVGTTFGSGVGTSFGSGVNYSTGSSFGSGTDTNYNSTPAQAQSSAATLPNNRASNSANESNANQQVQVRNNYYFIPFGFGGGTNYPEATPATKASETSSSSSSNSNATSVEASSANLYKISVDLGQFNNKAENVKLSVNNHTIKVYGGKYSQTFQIEKKIVKSGIRKEVSGNTLIIYVPLKD